MSEQAKEYAEVLEELRVELLGADAEVALLKNGANGFDVIATITRSFSLKRRSSVAIGQEFLQLRMSEQTGVDNAMCDELVAVEYLERTYKASVVDRFIDARRIVDIRLSDETQ
jgi:hypothetical protein